MIKARTVSGGIVYLSSRTTTISFAADGRVYAYFPNSHVELNKELMTPARLDAYQRNNYELGDFTNVSAVIDGAAELPNSGTEAFENDKIAEKDKENKLTIGVPS